MQHTMTNEDNV